MEIRLNHRAMALAEHHVSFESQTQRLTDDPTLMSHVAQSRHNDDQWSILAHTTIARGKLRVPSAPLNINREAPD